MEEVNMIFSHGALMCNNGHFLHILQNSLTTPKTEEKTTKIYLFIRVENNNSVRFDRTSL